MNILKRRLKQLRNEKRLTQRELANELKCSHSTIALYETGKRAPDTETLKTIANYFDVSIDYLLGVSNIKNITNQNIIENLKLVMQNMSIKQFVEFLNHNGITEDMIELYLESEAIPQIGTLSIIANKIGVDISFFYNKNNKDTFEIAKKEFNTDIATKSADENKYNELINKIKNKNLDIDLINKIIDSMSK